MSDSLLQRASILIQQSRYTDAITLLEGHLEKNPDDSVAKYLFASSLIQSGQKERGMGVVNALLAEEPDSPIVLSLATHAHLAEEKFNDAEFFAKKMTAIEPYAAESHVLMARVKLAQRNYDKAIESIDESLTLDPENIEALNLKTFVTGILDKSAARSSLQEALQLDPDNPFTIANQGLQLLREGKRKEALERLKYAMSLNPSNELARYALLEAIKSKFFLYRFFFAYKEWTARLTGTQMWIFILGSYFGFRFLNGLARQNPDLSPVLTPIIFIIAGFFLLTWIITPLTNLFLLLNPYGKLLLDDTDKKMARFTGMAFLAGLTCFGIYLMNQNENMLVAGLLCFLFMIPLGTFLLIENPQSKKWVNLMIIGILAAGTLGILFDISALIGLSFIGIFIYQFVFNGMMIKENSRTIDK